MKPLLKDLLLELLPEVIFDLYLRLLDFLLTYPWEAWLLSC